MPTKTLADVDPDRIYVTTNRSSSTKRIHTDPECRYLRDATNPVVEKPPDTYPEYRPVCLNCIDEQPPGPTDRSIYQAACKAGEANE